MKKVLIIYVLLCTIINAQAQKKNHIGIDPFSPIFGTFQIQYERSIVDKLSVSLTTSYKWSSGLFEIPGIRFGSFSTRDFSFEGFKVVPEFRYYVQNTESGLFGFYIGIYAKYQDSTGDIDGEYTDSDDIEFPIRMDAKIQTIATGFQAGYKLRVKRRFFIDFLIFGPGISYSEFELVEKEPVPQAFYDDLSEALEEYGFFDVINANFNINANQKTNITLPAFRYGFKLGYAF
ncbi:DUF3575 domain-containing protein [Aquimarina sp. AU474]|uniref:DUF3575 domain-containing protein n=1 Tax=Aquimarina sp. AU474 TaxID=2108529 RepID=UPI000D69EF0B|nr:DUF3575 domain-containing protein [Aquimarina sp. AU474]